MTSTDKEFWARVRERLRVAVGEEVGELGDDAYLFSWYAVKHALDTWERHYQILLGTSIRE